jgi:hypothetical protein
VVEEEIGSLVDGLGKRGVPSREGGGGKEVSVEEDISWQEVGKGWEGTELEEDSDGLFVVKA